MFSFLGTYLIKCLNMRTAFFLAFHAQLACAIIAWSHATDARRVFGMQRRMVKSRFWDSGPMYCVYSVYILENQLQIKMMMHFSCIEIYIILVQGVGILWCPCKGILDGVRVTRAIGQLSFLKKFIDDVTNLPLLRRR